MSKFLIKAVIIDDTPKAIGLLRCMIEELAGDDVVIAGEATNAAEGLQLITLQKPDLVFLDIEMPGKSGIELAGEMIKKGLNCNVVFTTAYNQYAIQAFRLSAIDYLLKPIQEQELIEAIQKVHNKLELHNSEKQLEILTQNLKYAEEKILSIPINNGYEFVPVKNIIYLEADGSYVRLYIEGQSPRIVSRNLRYFEQALEHVPSFFRVHRSFLINLQHMISYSRAERGIVIMQGGIQIDIARNRRTEFLEILQSLKS